MKVNASKRIVGVLAVLLSTAGPLSAALVITPDHVVGGSPTGTLVVIDVPTLDTTTVYTSASPGGPSWTTGGSIIATQADQGFKLQSRAGDTYGTQSPWEPDGTPNLEGKNYGVYNGTDPEVTYFFNLANSGIDIPDGAVINGVYMTWNTRGVDNANWTYNEGAGNVTTNIKYNVAPIADMTLRWFDSINNPHDAKFQKVFVGPIVVAGGDGFILTGFRQPNTLHADAIVIDVTFPVTTIIPEPATATLGLLAFGGLMRRRRRAA